MPKQEKKREPRRRPSQKSIKSVASSLASEGLSAPSLTNSQHSEIPNTSFTELVTLNEEGHPYVDINRLIYKPIEKHIIEEERNKKERLSWYIPDFCFIVMNLTSLCISTYFCLIGITTITWKASISMFAIPACWELYNGSSYSTPFREENFYYIPCKRFTKDAGEDFSEHKGYNFSIPNNFPILKTKLTQTHYFGLVLVCIELVNLVNVIVGINACLQGHKGILILHVIVDSMIVLGEAVVSAIVAFTSLCDEHDLRAIRVILKNFVHWYGTFVEISTKNAANDKPFNEELDKLQLSLGCCGVDGWIDYLAVRFPESNWYQSKDQLDKSEMVIPYSCCKSWWIRNIYCSHGAHLWSHPLATIEEANRFEERIVQEGCLYKLEKLCLNLRDWMGSFGFIVTTIHFVVITIEAISAFVLISSINKLIRKNKQIMRQKEIMHEAGDTTDMNSSLRRSSFSAKDGDKLLWANVPPPTEDEIITIKQRSSFNNFMARVRGGVVGEWMTLADKLVSQGHDDKKNEDEKNKREKDAEKKDVEKKDVEKKDVEKKDVGKKDEVSLENVNIQTEEDETATVLWKRELSELELEPATTDNETEVRMRRRRRRRRRKIKRRQELLPWFKNW